MPVDPQIVLTARLPMDLVRRLDAEVQRRRQQEPGVRYTRTDVIRSLLERGVPRPTSAPEGSAA